MSEVKHTPGPWNIINDDRSFIISAKDNSYDIAIVRNIGKENNESNANLIAAAPELLEELQDAHKIIRHALELMTVEQKTEWGKLNEFHGVEGEGVTRANEREAAIAKATGQKK